MKRRFFGSNPDFFRQTLSCLFLAVVLTTCFNPLDYSPSGNNGLISVALPGADPAKTLLTPTDKSGLTYELTFSGPGGQSITRTAAWGETCTVETPPGLWTVTVTAKDASAVKKAIGETVVDVKAGSQNSADVKLAVYTEVSNLPDLITAIGDDTLGDSGYADVFIVLKTGFLASTLSSTISLSHDKTVTIAMEETVTISRDLGFTAPFLNITGGHLILGSPAYGGTLTLDGSGSTAAPIVQMTSFASFTMNSGVLCNNINSGSNGGAVHVSGTFTMNGGTITGNKATGNGGGVYVAGKFIMNGGTITNNTATGDGDGVYVNGTFNISGDALVDENNDVYLASGKTITVTGPLTQQKAVKVTLASPADGTPVLTPGFPAGTIEKIAFTNPTHSLNSNGTLIVTDVSISANIYAVTPTGTGDGTGSWGNASNDLQAVINAAPSGSEIWVKAGVYKPNRKANATGTITPNDRDNAFVLKEGVEIYGGFAGIETERGYRNWRINETILSGDIGIEGLETDNTHHVVVIAGSSANPITNATVLDGFTISDGYGETNTSLSGVNGQSINRQYGGGIHNIGYAKPILENLTIKNNEAASGGGIYTKDSNAKPTIKNCIISNNTANNNNGGGLFADDGSKGILANVIIRANVAVNNGGGVYAAPSTLDQMVNVLVYDNNAAIEGGGLYLYGSSVDMINLTVVNNTVTDSTKIGGIYSNVSGTPAVRNCLIWGNGGLSNSSSSITYSYTMVQGMTVGGFDPSGSTASSLFADFGSGDYHLKSGSAAIDVGDDTSFTTRVDTDITTTDMDGNLRIFGIKIDLGAYEYQ